MDTVMAFNNELSALYETKPPISKAKMASITKSAMKAIKFYKHVVQSVEKFILKCKSDYKIPGLYVIDSIVRQSRHQFGAEKDVFAPRFARNMQNTFANLFKCAPEDKSKIIRVLNLWQKNNVFAPDVIQPLFDLADPNHPMYLPDQTTMGDNSSVTNGLSSGSGMQQENLMNDEQTLQNHTNLANSVLNNKNQFDQNTIRQLQQLQQLLIMQTGNEPSTSVGDSVKFNKKLLDFDYGEDEDEDKTANDAQHLPSLLDQNNIAQLLNDPNVLRQLQNLQKLKQHEMDEKQSKLNEMRIQEEAFEKHLVTVLKKLPFANECDLSRQQTNDITGQNAVALYQASLNNIGNLMQQQNNMQSIDNEAEVEFVSDDKVEVINLDGNDSRSPTPDRDRYKRRRSRSRSRDRGRDRRRRSRSRSRSRGSRSPRQNRRSSRDRDRDRTKEREKERRRELLRERKRRGLPNIKKDHLSVCSTTLWVGHLSKLVQQEELSDTFGKYGEIVSIDMIHPRGCAFIVMHRRQDAYKAMQHLRSHKLQGRAITISWAAGKGVKSKEWKDYWEIEDGVSYIPWDKITINTDLEALEEGGMFDEEAMPQWLKDKVKDSNLKKDDKNDCGIINPPGMFTLGDVSGVDTSQPPPSAPAMLPMVPPFTLGGVPRLIPPPIGLGMSNMGIPMGVPPPQMMIPGPPQMVPGLPPLGPPPQMDKSIPPPQSTGVTSNSRMTEPFFTLASGFVPPLPITPHAPPIPHSLANTNTGDDHMDIEMEDDNLPPKSNDNKTQLDLAEVLNAIAANPNALFNCPPPHLGMGLAGLQFNTNNMQDKMDFNSKDRERDDDRDPSRERDRDFRGDNRRMRDRDRDRERGDRDRDRDRERDRERDRRDYNRNDRDRDRSSRWGDRPRSRERDRDRERMDRDRGDRNPKDMLERDKPLHDRLRDMANDGMNIRGDFNRSRDQPPSLLDLPLINDPNMVPLQIWRGQQPGANFPGNFMDQGRRNLDMPIDGPGVMLPHLDNVRNIMRADDMRGPIAGAPGITRPPMLMQNDRYGHNFDFRQRDDFDRLDNMDRRGGPREFFSPNRFGAPNGPGGPRGMGIGRTGPQMQFGPRNPMYMRGPRSGPGFQFNDRPYFDRDERGPRGNNRGNSNNMDNRRGGGGRQWRENNNNNNNNKKSSRWNNNQDRDDKPDYTRRSDSSHKSDENDKDTDKSNLDDFDAIKNNNSESFEDNGPPGYDNDDFDNNDSAYEKNANSEKKPNSKTYSPSQEDNCEDANTTPLYDEPNDHSENNEDMTVQKNSNSDTNMDNNNLNTSSSNNNNNGGNDESCNNENIDENREETEQINTIDDVTSTATSIVVP